MGQVLQAGQGQIPSRQAQIKAGIPKEVSSETINKVCASGLRASVILDQAIRAGDVEVGVGGGMESMSQAPVPAAAGALRLPHGRRQGARRDGPRRADQPVQRASRCSTRRPRSATSSRSRAPDLDRWALRSHERALAATDEGRMADEIVPVTVKGRKGDTVVEVDEGPRRGSSLEALAKLPGPGRQGGLAHRRQLARRQRRRRRARARLATSGRRPTARRRWPRSSPTRRAPTTSPTWPRRRRGAAKKALEKAGLQAERHRPVGDQRGVRLGDAELDPPARHRRGARSTSTAARSRSATRSAPPARASSARSSTSCAAAAAGYGCAAICSGGGQGDARHPHGCSTER